MPCVLQCSLFFQNGNSSQGSSRSASKLYEPNGEVLLVALYVNMEFVFPYINFIVQPVMVEYWVAKPEFFPELNVRCLLLSLLSRNGMLALQLVGCGHVQEAPWILLCCFFLQHRAAS